VHAKVLAIQILHISINILAEDWPRKNLHLACFKTRMQNKERKNKRSQKAYHSPGEDVGVASSKNGEPAHDGSCPPTAPYADAMSVVAVEGVSESLKKPRSHSC
jgi:hypothetical protein